MTLRRAALALALLFGLAAPALAGDDSAGRLAAFDALVRTGKAAKLRGKLEGKGMLGVYSDVEGEFLDFWLTGEPAPGGKPGTATLDKEKFLGSGKTDSSGMGELEWTPEGPGAYEVEVRVRKGSKYVAIPATLDVLAAANDRPLTVVVVEQTLTDLSALTFMRKDEKDIPVAEGAAEALTKVNEKHGIVYLTGIEEVSLVKTKDWLRKKSFPRGPVFFWNVSQNAFKGETYKANAVAKLRSDFPSFTSFVGGKTEDANAAVKNGVTGFVVASPDADVPAEAIKIKKWDRLAAAIDRQHEVEGLVAELAAPDLEKQDKAGKALSRLETGELGYLNRLLRTTDPSVGAAARLVLGRIRARDAFAASLDLSSDSTALASLIAAWRAGDPSVTVRCYRDAASAGKAGPPIDKFRGIEVVNRSEPEPGKVVYRLRFLGEKDNVERDYAFVRGDDNQWRVDAGDL